MNFTEIEKLDTMLVEAGIPHTFEPLHDGYQIIAYYDSECKQILDDCVIRRGSHGHEVGLLETYALNDCAGYETAEEIFAGWKEMYEKGKGR